MIYKFEKFSLDTEAFTLSDESGETIALEPRALELLILLVQDAGQLVSNATINREVWGGLHVSRTAVSYQLRSLRNALGDRAKPNRLIETVHGRGMRFVGKLSLEKGAEPLGDAAPIATLEPLDGVTKLESDLIGERPRIAVLPFREGHSDEGLVGLARALPTDIIVALSRLKTLRVNARSSSFLFQDATSSAKTLKFLMGADYTVTGSVSRAGSSYLIYAELVEAQRQAVVWADTFEQEPRDVHDVRAQIVDRILAQCVKRIHKHEAQRTHLKQPESMTAWEAFHTGISLAERLEQKYLMLARTCFERAVRIEPEFAQAWAGLASTHLMDVISGQKDASKMAGKRMIQCAEKAMEADSDDASANLYFGWSRQLVHDRRSPVSWYERSLDIAPSYSLAHRLIGSEYTSRNAGELAVKHTSTAILLDPYGPDRYGNYRDLAVAKFLVGDVPAALEWGCKAGEAPFNEVQILMAAVCANHLKGDLAKAEKLAARMKSALVDTSWRDAYGTQILGKEHTVLFGNILSIYGID